MDDRELQEAGLDAMQHLLNTIDPTAVVTRFVILAEVVDEEHGRCVWAIRAPDQRAWDTLGLLDFARSLEYAAADKDDD